MEAYDYVKTHWAVDHSAEKTFMIITESLHCNEADVGLHVYWMVSNLDFDDENQRVIIMAEEVPLAKAFNDVSCPIKDRVSTDLIGANGLGIDESAQ